MRMSHCEVTQEFSTAGRVGTTKCPPLTVFKGQYSPLLLALWESSLRHPSCSRIIKVVSCYLPTVAFHCQASVYQEWTSEYGMRRRQVSFVCQTVSALA